MARNILVSGPTPSLTSTVSLHSEIIFWVSHYKFVGSNNDLEYFQVNGSQVATQAEFVILHFVWRMVR